MIHQLIQPAEELRPYIQQYIYLKAEGSTDTMLPPEEKMHFRGGLHVQRIFPSCGFVIFIRNTEVLVIDRETEDAVVVGPRTTAFDMTTLHGWFEGFHIDFKPGGLQAIMGQQEGMLSEKILIMEDLHDEPMKYYDRIWKEGMTPEIFANVIDAAFVSRLRPIDKQQLERLTRVVEACDEKKGAISVGEMAGVACLSERQFNRVFNNYIGMKPKDFVRVRRFHRTLQDMQAVARAGWPIDFTDQAIRHGYYDPSHMAAEFKTMGCVTPSNFQQLGIPLRDDYTLFFS